MWFKRFRILLVMVVQLAFFSQAIAAVQLPCEAMNQHTESAAHRAMDHHNHPQVFNVSTDEMSPCCDHKQCIKNHCASVGYSGAAMVDSYTQLLLHHANVHTTEYAVNYPSRVPSSLFRPPNYR